VRRAVDAIFDALDLTNVPVGLLLTPASLDQKEAVTGGAGTAAGRWCRSVTMGLLSETPFA